MTDTILDVRNLQVQFQIDDRLAQAVDGISFAVKRGQTLGIVGESGSGKSVTALAVMGLLPCPPGQVAGGEIWFRAEDAAPIDLLTVSQTQMQRYRGDQISMIFQEPMSSLNPVFTIGFQLVEAICLHQGVTKSSARRQAIGLLQKVKLLASDVELQQRYREEFSALNPTQPMLPDREIEQRVNAQKLAFLDRYPHQLSGGQLQRVMIAMAISNNPTLLIADEPTTALDVTVQATILDLLRELRDAAKTETGQHQMSMMFITHDLGVIAEIADAVAVMYQGNIVEYGPVLEVFANPQHPYTKGLLTCRPRPDRRLKYLPTVSDFMEVVTSPTGEPVIQEKPLDVDQALRVATEISAAELEDP